MMDQATPYKQLFHTANSHMAGPSGLAVQGIGLRPFACWDCGFESRRQHEYLSLGSVVSYRSVRRADHSSRGVRVWCVWVWSRILDNEEVLAH